jgi:DNA polymerase III delta subunit
VVARPGARIDVSEAERLLAGPASAIPPLTLAAGSDDFLRDRVVAAFRAGAAAERSDLSRLEGDDLSAGELAATLASISLFGDARRIWIREGSKIDRATEEILLGWVAGSGEGVRVLLTTARDVSELKLLQTLSGNATVVACTAGPAESRRWVAQLAKEALLRLPAGAAEAIAAHAPNLLVLSREIEKLRLHAGADGSVPAAALDVLAGARSAASAERWATAVLAGDTARARAEAATLDAEGVGGTGCLWAIAERALAALDPQPYGSYRRSGQAGPALGSADARRALHVVYTADRALKRGEIRDSELRDYVEHAISDADHV